MTLAAEETPRDQQPRVHTMEPEDPAALAPKHRVDKFIGDLDSIVQLLAKSLPAANPWQRQLLQQLSDIDRNTQVLRMTLALNRPSGEVIEARNQLRLALRVAQRSVTGGRANLGTKAAVVLACELGGRIEAMLS